MLQEHSRFFQRIMFAADFLLVIVSWVISYYIRFEILSPPEWVPITRYLALLPWIVFVSILVFWASGLYAPDRAQRLSRLVFGVAKAVSVELIFVAASLSFYRALSFSRLHMILFAVMTPGLMVLFRGALFYYIRRRTGHSVRVLIVGAGKVGKKLVDAFRQFPWLDFDLVGFADDNPAADPMVIGTTADVAALVDRFRVDGNPVNYVYIALPLSASQRIEELVGQLSTRLVHVCLVPDLFQFDLLNSRITHLDGLPVIHIIDEGPFELSRVIKRVVDIVFSAFFLMIAAPLLLAIAVSIKLSSRGPVFYRQERMGLNGKTFSMLKFRSMPVDTEAHSGPVWAKQDEQRATPLGAFLRRSSLDELPQFINVLRGEMSIVGPRPERPFFIEQFKDQVPGYMLRHKTKAGITGWAQVHGWRGNTSLEKRIEYDLYYIQNWSLALDLRIMIMTLGKGFASEHAY